LRVHRHLDAERNDECRRLTLRESSDALDRLGAAYGIDTATEDVDRRFRQITPAGTERSAAAARS
jgi:hypothetical protein